MCADTGQQGQRHGRVRPFRHVLVGWDGSPDSLAAFQAAIGIVGDEPGMVTAFAVLPLGHEPEANLDRETLPGIAAREAFESARASVAAATPARVSFRSIESGRTVQAICDYADEHSFDLLVVGRHGFGGLLSGSLGHVSQGAVKHSKVPVLLVSAR
jgi:nucleotide-binding universal stress UspA family protein